MKNWINFRFGKKCFFTVFFPYKTALGSSWGGWPYSYIYNRHVDILLVADALLKFVLATCLEMVGNKSSPVLRCTKNQKWWLILWVTHTLSEGWGLHTEVFVTIVMTTLSIHIGPSCSTNPTCCESVVTYCHKGVLVVMHFDLQDATHAGSVHVEARWFGAAWWAHVGWSRGIDQQSFMDGNRPRAINSIFFSLMLSRFKMCMGQNTLCSYQLPWIWWFPEFAQAVNRN